MKKLTTLMLVLLVSTASVIITGCTTTAPDGTTQPIVTQQTLNDAAVALRSAARVSATIAIQDKGDEARKYVVLAVAALDQFAVGTTYEPGKLVESLKPVLSQVNDPKVAIAINTVADLYEVFYGRYVKSKLAENTNAKMFIQALRDGASSALDISPASAAAPPK